MNNLILSVENFLYNHKISFTKLDSGKTFNFEINVPEGNWVCRLNTREKSGISVYSILPIKLENGKLAEIAIYLMKLNSEIMMGNFELNSELNEIKFKTYIDADSGSVNERIIERNILVNNAIMQKYVKTIIQKTLKQRSTSFYFW